MQQDRIKERNHKAVSLHRDTIRFRHFFANLGPGLITGTGDDDPSGISTYSVIGAAFGYAPLWTALFGYAPLWTALFS
jgi:Mn2+/Fe2+ NRAMP family transporter